MMQRLHLHNCPSKAISGDTKKIPQRKLVWQSPFYYSHQGDKFYESDILYSQRFGFGASRNCWVLRGSGPRPFSCVASDAIRLLDGEKALSILQTKTLLYHIALQPVRITTKKNCRKETKKSSSITTLINTKGYPILYTVVCDIRGPYKMLSLSLDFVLILSWCIKY